jgi:hypothetical protein
MGKGLPVESTLRKGGAGGSCIGCMGLGGGEPWWKSGDGVICTVGTLKRFAVGVVQRRALLAQRDWGSMFSLLLDVLTPFPSRSRLSFADSAAAFEGVDRMIS